MPPEPLDSGWNCILHNAYTCDDNWAWSYMYYPDAPQVRMLSSHPAVAPDANEAIGVQLKVSGTTEKNKVEICEAIAAALGGIVSGCILEAATSRRMLQDGSLFVNVAVDDAVVAQATVESEDFSSSVTETLPEGASVTGVILSACTISDDCNGRAESVSGTRPRCKCSYCYDGWTGDHCEIEPRHCNTEDDCNGHASGVWGQPPRCHCYGCDDGYSGEKCEIASASGSFAQLMNTDALASGTTVMTILALVGVASTIYFVLNKVLEKSEQYKVVPTLEEN